MFVTIYTTFACLNKIIMSRYFVAVVLALALTFATETHASTSSSSGASSATTSIGGNHSNVTHGGSHGLHPHAAGGQGEIHFICFVLCFERLLV